MLCKEFDRAHCLLNAEVLLLLDDIQARRQVESQHVPLPPPSKYGGFAGPGLMAAVGFFKSARST